MNNINSYITQLNFLLLGLGIFSFFIKMVLYYKVEKGWDPVRFLRFSRVDLKMTVSKDLRNSRKTQNLLTKLFLTFILLFGMSTFFRIIIS
ncbi:hypothetical protein [Segetibacter sp.]|jgi:hypothetical protein|uniref:hypothetical protein n=1 Tax=Segetibacter sp. TaxID=2231182 RepID=UPI002616D4E7|nr:hypothetical protein [Segetibacter sp.]MCW3080008.1 hypothetical protein [Segetibacter sp.]